MSEPNAQGSPVIGGAAQQPGPQQGGWPPQQQPPQQQPPQQQGPAPAAWQLQQQPQQPGPAPAAWQQQQQPQQPGPAPAAWQPQQQGPAPAAWPPQQQPQQQGSAPAAWQQQTAGAAWAAPGQPAQVQPSLFARLDPRGWRVTILAAIIMVGVVGGANAVNGAIPVPTGGGSSGYGGTGVPVKVGDPLTVSSGVRFAAPAGWSVVKSEDGIIVLGKGTAALVVQGGPYSGTPAELEAQYRASLSLSAGDKASSPQEVTFGNGIPGLGAVFAKSTSSGPIDGLYIVGATSGRGVIFSLMAPQGDLSNYQGDADAVLAGLTIAGGG